MGWSAYRKTGLTFHNPNLSVKGYTLFTPLAADSTYLINMNGKIVKRWQFDDIKPNHARLLPSGNLMVSGTDPDMAKRVREAEEKDYEEDLTLHFQRLGGGYTCLKEYDFDGNLLWSYDNPAMHHDFYLLDNNNLLLPEWVALPEDVAKAVRGGFRTRRKQRLPMMGDDIVEVDRAGNKNVRCQVWQLFNPRRDPIQPLQARWEWTHMNSLDLTAGQQFYYFLPAQLPGGDYRPGSPKYSSGNWAIPRSASNTTPPTLTETSKSLITV